MRSRREERLEVQCLREHKEILRSMNTANVKQACFHKPPFKGSFWNLIETFVVACHIFIKPSHATFTSQIHEYDADYSDVQLGIRIK